MLKLEVVEGVVGIGNKTRYIISRHVSLKLCSPYSQASYVSSSLQTTR